MFNNMWDVKEPKHYSKRVGREVPGVVAVLCVVDTGPMLIAVTTITEMVILYKYVEINQSLNQQKMHQALVNMKKPFMNQLPIPMLHLSPKQLQEARRQLRQVSKKSHKPKFSNICTQDNKKIILSRS